MKLTIPLFQYISGDEKEFEFSSRPFSIGRIDIKHDIPKIDLFSNQDIKNIQKVEWCIIIDGNIPENYEEEINLLVMAFELSQDAMYLQSIFYVQVKSQKIDESMR